MIRFWLLGFVAVMVMGSADVAARDISEPLLPEADGQKHLGVASCASSVCHGAPLERQSTTVLQNEYVTWSRHDHHSGAYNTLLNAASARIATNLGLGDAKDAAICLDCHADNVANEFRGPEFDLTDGVGCEACHGGSESWIASHVLPKSERSVHQEVSFYPTHTPEALGRLCLSCHLGTENKLTTHRLMGAGHPRLSFELVTFLELLPPHWARDDDYKARKSETDLVGLWVSGQLTAADEMLELIEQHTADEFQLIPEIALFDCHACHHAMTEQRWRTFALTQGVDPGALRINLAPFAFLIPIAEGLETASSKPMLESIRILNRSTGGSRAEFKLALAKMSTELREVRSSASRALDPSMRMRMLRSLAENAAVGDYHDYALAEQAAMAMNLMLRSLNLWDATRPKMQAVFATLESETDYQPAAFARSASNLLEEI